MRSEGNIITQRQRQVDSVFKPEGDKGSLWLSKDGHTKGTEDANPRAGHQNLINRRKNAAGPMPNVLWNE
ncbi:hypothetical protein KQX54_005577 [Cotesia glomerata]|uniref:Uncharacterized protein n=1 Tax=Cotesia glomerata TaxID=32391 RepID=A0AAV7I3U9_COTGL|nr:hypothetical protein KQX54_005577 [Cotesia glomerata]